MPTENFFLITTSDEATWRFDCPIVFLGEWCCKYDRKHVWENLDFNISLPYGLKKSEKEKDYEELLKLEKKLFPKFCELLNKYHNTSFSERFWQIFIGHWFRLTITQLIFKIKALKQCLERFPVSSTLSFSFDKYSITPNSFLESIDDRLLLPWKENILYSKILNLLKNVNFEIKYLDIKQKNKLKEQQDIYVKNINYKQQFFLNLIKYYNKLSKKFVRKNDALIINSYLPLKDEIRLQLSLGQFPQLWKYKVPINWNQKLQNLNLNPEKRDKLIKNFESNSDNDLEIIICKLLFELLPKIYLEGFEELRNIAYKQPWPESPKFIFTSNEFFSNEIFKLWSALKVENGIKYFIGQHGNNYGTMKYRSPRVEEIVADKFITWGWKNNSKKFIPAFIFKNGTQKKYKFDPNGGLLLVQTCYTKNFTTYDRKFQYLRYLEDQIKFVDLLAKASKQNITIRLNPEYLISRWSVKKRWLDFDNKINLEFGKANISKLISQNRLVVHSYDSTGILETLSRNIPTIAFWLDDYDHLVDEAKPYYELLFNAGIIHFSSESASKKINKIWNNIEDWWNQKEIQEARKKFCNQYAKHSNNPVFELKKILLS